MYVQYHGERRLSTPSGELFAGRGGVVVPAAGSLASTCLVRQLHLPLLRAKRCHFERHAARQVRTRRLNGRGHIKLFGRQRAVGRAHAGKRVTVVLEDGVATILDGERVLRRLVLDEPDA